MHSALANPARKKACSLVVRKHAFLLETFNYFPVLPQMISAYGDNSDGV